MRYLILSILALSIAIAGEKTMDFYALKSQTIEGESVALAAYKGKVLLIVNTASQCGYTPQYGPLQEVYQAYQEKGLVVLGFPSNDFGRQEPGSNDEIAQFCESRFGVTFPMFAKSSVKGPEQNDVFKYLTENAPETGPVKWNFEKFLVDREGKVIARFRSSDAPNSDKLKQAIEAAL